MKYQNKEIYFEVWKKKQRVLFGMCKGLSRQQNVIYCEKVFERCYFCVNKDQFNWEKFENLYLLSFFRGELGVFKKERLYIIYFMDGLKER